MNFETFLENNDASSVTVKDFRNFGELKGVLDFFPSKKGNDKAKGVRGFHVLIKDGDEWSIVHVGLIKDKSTLLLDSVSTALEKFDDKMKAITAFAKYIKK